MSLSVELSVTVRFTEPTLDEATIEENPHLVTLAGDIKPVKGEAYAKGDVRVLLGTVLKDETLLKLPYPISVQHWVSHSTGASITPIHYLKVDGDKLRFMQSIDEPWKNKWQSDVDEYVLVPSGTSLEVFQKPLSEKTARERGRRSADQSSNSMEFNSESLSQTSEISEIRLQMLQLQQMMQKLLVKEIKDVSAKSADTVSPRRNE